MTQNGALSLYITISLSPSLSLFLPLSPPLSLYLPPLSLYPPSLSLSLPLSIPLSLSHSDDDDDDDTTITTTTSMLLHFTRTVHIILYACAVKSITFISVECKYNFWRNVLLLTYICLDFAFKSSTSDKSLNITCQKKWGGNFKKYI